MGVGVCILFKGLLCSVSVSAISLALNSIVKVFFRSLMPEAVSDLHNEERSNLKTVNSGFP